MHYWLKKLESWSSWGNKLLFKKNSKTSVTCIVKVIFGHTMIQCVSFAICHLIFTVFHLFFLQILTVWSEKDGFQVIKKLIKFSEKIKIYKFVTTTTGVK